MCGREFDFSTGKESIEDSSRILLNFIRTILFTLYYILMPGKWQISRTFVHYSFKKDGGGEKI
jgi:hypothetical protein